jgi:hypothetical protein
MSCESLLRKQSDRDFDCEFLVRFGEFFILEDFWDCRDLFGEMWKKVEYEK